MSGVFVYRCCVVLVFALYGLWMWVDYRQWPVLADTDVTPVQSKDTIAVSDGQFQFASLIEMAEVTTRPLFVDGREYNTVDDDTPDTQNKKEPPFHVVVTGIVRDGDQYMAVLRDTKTGSEQTLYLGEQLPDTYAEWRLQQVDGYQVLVKKNTENNDDESIPIEWSRKQLPLVEEGVYYTIEGSSQEDSDQK